MNKDRHAAPPAKTKAAMNRRTPKRLPEFWQLLIDCKNEREQERLYRELQKRGIRCKLLIM